MNDSDWSVEAVIDHHIENVVAMCDGNISRAAKVIGWHRRTLQRYLRRKARKKKDGRGAARRRRMPKRPAIKRRRQWKRRR